jgi:uncharacterized protein YbjT (DUF2867 family)
MKIVVIGGTGLIGSKVVQHLTDQGHETVPASPRLGVDTITGEGVAEAVAGASVVIDVSNSPNFEYMTALPFFERSTHNLLAAEAAANVGHHVALSVVGTRTLSQSGDPETTTAGYFRAKLTQEELIQASGIPYTVVHATQFFEFITSIADVQMRDGVVRLPPVVFQPMAALDVARAVARAAIGAPANCIVEVGGPERAGFEDIVRRVLRASNDAREIVSDPDAGYYGMPVSERTLVPGDDATLGDIRLADWLHESAATTSAVG